MTIDASTRPAIEVGAHSNRPLRERCGPAGRRGDQTSGGGGGGGKRWARGRYRPLAYGPPAREEAATRGAVEAPQSQPQPSPWAQCVRCTGGVRFASPLLRQPRGSATAVGTAVVVVGAERPPIAWGGCQGGGGVLQWGRLIQGAGGDPGGRSAPKGGGRDRGVGVESQAAWGGRGVAHPGRSAWRTLPRPQPKKQWCRGTPCLVTQTKSRRARRHRRGVRVAMAAAATGARRGSAGWRR